MVDRYKKKQFGIALVYLTILVVVVGGIFLISRIGAPTCNDGIQNQGEVGVDCGEPCALCDWQTQAELEIIFTQAIETQPGYVDLIAEIENPNQEFGGEVVSYKFNLYDSSDNLIVSKKGKSYILPEETKYIIEQKVLAEDKISRVELEIESVNWKEFKDYQSLELLIKNPDLRQSENSGQLSATLENRSNYDLDEVELYAVLFDKDSNVIGVGKTKVESVLSKENRYFEIIWLGQNNVLVEKSNIVAKTNVFLDANFMKRYGGEKKDFQNY